MAWRRLLQGGSPAAGADPRLTVRAVSGLFGSAVALSWVYVLLADLPPGRERALAVLAGVATVIFVLSTAFARRLPRTYRPAVLVVVIALVSAAMALTGGLTSPFALFYAWAAAWAVVFLPARIAVAMLGLVVAGALVAVLAHGVAEGVDGLEAATALFRAGTVIALAALVAALSAATRRHERALRRREAQQQRVAALGVAALAEEDPGRLAALAVDSLAELLEVPFAAYLERDVGRQYVIPRAVRGWPPDSLTVDAPLALELAPLAALVLARDEPVVSDDLAAEQRFEPAGVARDHELVSAVAVPVRGREGIYGVLGAHDHSPRGFAPEDVDFALALAGVLGVATERRATEEAMRHQSVHDPLTGIPNRVLFFDRLGHAVSRARRQGIRLAVLYLDLDGFKAINDSLGHQAGDALLAALAPRLRAAVRGSDTVARLGGDEFAVLCEDIARPEEAKEVAARLLAAVHRPVEWAGTSIGASVSVGISVSGVGGAEPDALVRDADAALYRAKSRGGGAMSCGTTRCGPASRRAAAPRPPCGARLTATSSTSPSSRWSSSRPRPCSGRRRSCAGSGRTAPPSLRASSSPWPRSRA